MMEMLPNDGERFLLILPSDFLSRLSSFHKEVSLELERLCPKDVFRRDL